MKWITHTHLHVDRGACCWLIQRFIDSEAEFHFVTKEIVLAVAEHSGAIPFDMPGVELGHHNGYCSFISLLRKYAIQDPVLWKLADIINASDSPHVEADKYAPGVEAIVEGLSIQYPEDEVLMDQQFVLYDALYAALKNRITVNKGREKE